MLRSRLLWQLAGSQIALVVAAVVLPAAVGPLVAAPVIVGMLAAVCWLNSRFVDRVRRLTSSARMQLAEPPTDPARAQDELTELESVVAAGARQAELMEE